MYDLNLESAVSDDSAVETASCQTKSAQRETEEYSLALRGLCLCVFRCWPDFSLANSFAKAQFLASIAFCPSGEVA